MARFFKSHLSPQKEFSDNLMKYVVKEQVIPYKSKLFQQGLEQFQNNMKLVLNLFKNTKYQFSSQLSELI